MEEIKSQIKSFLESNGFKYNEDKRAWWNSVYIQGPQQIISINGQTHINNSMTAMGMAFSYEDDEYYVENLDGTSHQDIIWCHWMRITKDSEPVHVQMGISSYSDFIDISTSLFGIVMN